MSAERERVSVIVPAYNEASRLGAALESALAQTLPPHEIIVIDDGSTDDTAAVAARYSVRVLGQENRGISAARNRAFREATGSWLALLDSDDVWLPERLAWLARASTACPDVGFGFSDYTVEENGVPNASSNLARTPQFRAVRAKAVRDGIALIERAELCDALAVGNFLGTSTVFVRRKLVMTHELYFDETLPLRAPDYQLSEDIEWYLRVLKWTDALAIDRVLARYVRRPDSAAEAYGRVRFGDVKLGERIAAAPQAYALGAPAAFAREKRHHQRHAASIHAREANFAAARAILGGAQHERYHVSDALRYAVATLLDCNAGRRALRGARAVWQRALRPLVRTLAQRIRRA